MELSAHVATAITMQYTHVHVFMLFVIVRVVFMKIVYIIN